MYLTPDNYTPTLLHSLDDKLLTYSYLEIFTSSYLPYKRLGEIDPLASPILAPSYIFDKFPSVRLCAGTGDPLHDDVWRFFDKLIHHDCDVKYTVYFHMPHAFLLLDYPGGLPEAKKCVSECSSDLLDLIYTCNKKKSYAKIP
mmetsp:Transcript_31662/g.28792  ORF Transcript_31662/g.28792 Transcript_31662/m.28792 type:complete len:143 (-) Transcript_31662:1809-2237(-)